MEIPGKFLRTRARWTGCLLLAASSFLQACVPIYYQTTNKLELREVSPPVLPPELAAPKGADAISIVRPIRSEWGGEIYRGIQTSGGIPSQPNPGIFFVLVLEHKFFVPSVDPQVWVADGLAAGLKNAGYRVEGPGALERANTPVVITVDVSRLAVERTTRAPPACEATVAARVKVMKRGHVILDRRYGGKREEPGSCVDDLTLSLGMEEALKNLLRQAVPELAALLANAAQPQRCNKPITS